MDSIFVEQKFGLLNYLLESSQNKFKINKDNSIPLFVSIEDLSENNVMDSNLLLYFLDQISDIDFGISPDSYVKLIDYPSIIEIIFKYIFDLDIFCYKIPNRSSNIIMKFPYNVENEKILNEFCSTTYWSYVIYMNQKDIGFKRINIKREKDEDKLENKEIKKLENIKDEFIYNPRRLKFNPYKIYAKIYRNKIWFNFNDELDYNNNIIRKIKNMKRWFRFKWFPLLLPIYIIDNINVNDMLNDIWFETNKYMKIKFSFQDIMELGLHPLQLVGSTTLVLFRRQYKGNETIFERFQNYYNNSLTLWTKIPDKDIYQIILSNIIWNYSYSGQNILFEYLKLPLIQVDDSILNLINYPFNLNILLNYITNNISEETRINNLTKIHDNSFYISENRKRYIELFMDLI